MSLCFKPRYEITIFQSNINNIIMRLTLKTRRRSRCGCYYIVVFNILLVDTI